MMKECGGSVVFKVLLFVYILYNTMARTQLSFHAQSYFSTAMSVVSTPKDILRAHLS